MQFNSCGDPYHLQNIYISVDWFLYDRGICHERVDRKLLFQPDLLLHGMLLHLNLRFFAIFTLKGIFTFRVCRVSRIN